MKKIRNNKRNVESFVVAKRGTSLYAPVTNTHLTDNSTGKIVLADGQLGIFATSGTIANKSIIAADTAVQAPDIAIYQGTDQTAILPYPLWTRPYEKTQDIETNFNIYATKQPYKAGTNSVWAISNITALPSATFGMSIGMRGRAAQEFFSSQESAYLQSSFVTPAYTSGQLATAAPVSEIVNNLVYDLLRNSARLSVSIRNRGGNWPVIAFAVDTTAAAGVAISSLTAGTAVPVVSATSGGTRSVVLNAEEVASLKAALTASGLAAGSTIVVASTTAPVLANAILIMGVDRDPVFKDYEVMNKTRIEVGLTYGFNIATVSSKEFSFAAEAQGSGKQLAMKYKFTQGQRKYNLIDITDPVVEFANPFDVTETYDVIAIHHDRTDVIDTHNTVTSPMVEFICIPTATKGVAGVSALYTALVTRLDGYFTSAGKGVILND